MAGFAGFSRVRAPQQSGDLLSSASPVSGDTAPNPRIANSRSYGGRRGRTMPGAAKKDASWASKLLSNKKTPKRVKSVAASDLAQARHKPKPRKK